MVGATNSSMRGTYGWHEATNKLLADGSPDTYGWHEAMTNKLLTDGSPVSLRHAALRSERASPVRG